jgi:xanthine dehydrogenase YagR molybdenum-binding subunit
VKREHSSGVVGRPYPRVEAPDKVTGRARYSSDVRLEGQLSGRILRSPWPHARVLRVDTSAAEALPGVRAVLSRFNAPDIPWYEEGKLFDETVRFVGDEVAAVAADSEEIAEDALRLVAVEYERLPFKVALEEDASGKTQTKCRGDVAAGLREADLVIEDVFTTQTALHNCMEPHGCVAAWEAGRLTLHESTQGLFSVRCEVAGKLGLPEDHVRVITQHMGGGFGSKQIAWKHSVIAALLARKAGRPVQILLDRESENLAAGNRNATRQHLKIGARLDGTLTAIDVRVFLQAGAYTAGGEESDVIGTYQTLYRCPNVRAEQTSVRTNTGPAIAFRAPGYAEATFALESAMDQLARELKMDPIELRLRNYAEADQVENKPYTSPDSLRKCYGEIRKAFDSFERKPSEDSSKRRGIGFAAHDWIAGSGHPPAEALVRIGEDGRAVVVTGTQDIGTGTRTALCQIAAEELGISPAHVTIELGDTARGLQSPTSAGSATLASLGPAVREAAESAKTHSAGKGVRGPNPFHKAIRTCGAQCAEVEVDVETGEVTLLRVVSAHDCGRVVNPTMVDSQVYGGVTQGAGFALTERRIVDEASGVVLNANLEEYLVPTVADVPHIHNATLSMPDLEANITGAKGIGEPPLIPTAPAIANAIYDAIGVRLRELPLSREKILESL